MRAFLVALAALLALAASAAAVGTPAYRITAIEPVLFFTDDGTFSKPIPEDASLWNTVIGEGWAGKASNATFVKVHVAGEPGSYGSRSIRLVVQWGARDRGGRLRWKGTVLRRTAGINVLPRSGRSVVGFWIYEQSCNPLLVTARIVGQTAPSTTTRLIPFACGE